MLATRTHVATNRLVFTYEPEGFPGGILSGYEDVETGGFVLEHVVVFPDSPPTTLMRMCYAGLLEGWARGYAYIACRIRVDYPIVDQLRRLAERAGFTEYAREGDSEFWVRYKP